jgi:hypothetical protein
MQKIFVNRIGFPAKHVSFQVETHGTTGFIIS